MQQDLFIRKDLTIPGAELEVQATVGGGPGGQHVNKSATRITLRWSVARSAVLRPWHRNRLMERWASRLTKEGEVVIHVHQHRSQQRNLDAARERLVSWIQAALEVQKVRRATKPTRASKRRRVDNKKKRAHVKKGRGRVRYDDS